jgi:hypothetical protein
MLFLVPTAGATERDRISRKIPPGSVSDPGIGIAPPETEFLNIGGVLAFSQRILTSPAHLWMDSSLDQKQRLQQLYFPDGVSYDGKEIKTPSSGSFFSMLCATLDDQSHMASPTGFEPVLSP